MYELSTSLRFLKPWMEIFRIFPAKGYRSRASKLILIIAGLFDAPVL